MRIADTEREFLRIALARGREVAALRPDEAVDVMLEFYRSVRSPEVEPQQGDALLYQWGVFDWGKGRVGRGLAKGTGAGTGTGTGKRRACRTCEACNQRNS